MIKRYQQDFNNPIFTGKDITGFVIFEWTSSFDPNVGSVGYYINGQRYDPEEFWRQALKLSKGTCYEAEVLAEYLT